MLDDLKRKGVIFFCHNIGYKKGDLGDFLSPPPDASIRFVGLPCSGKIEVQFLLKTFETGVDAVFILGCLDGTCHHADGNQKMRKRVQYVKDILDKIDVDGDRLEMFQISHNSPQGVQEAMTRIIERINGLSHSPLK